MTFEKNYFKSTNYIKNIDWKYSKNILKKGAYYLTYVGPGVGLYREYKKPEEKRKIHKKIWWVGYSAGAVLKLGLTVAFVANGIQTGEWNPFTHFSNAIEYTWDKIENVFEKKQRNKLEKTLYINQIENNKMNN